MNSPTGNEQQDSAFAALVVRAARGDMVAFRSIVERHHALFYRIAYRFLRDRHNAEDVVQEAWIRIWNHLPRYRPSVKFTTWGYRIVTHLCLDSARRDKRRQAVSRPIADDPPLGENIGTLPADEAMESKYLCERILLFAQTLPPRENMVFQLRDVQDCSIPEIAEILEISENAVRVNLCHARSKIRAKMIASERATPQ